MRVTSLARAAVIMAASILAAGCGAASGPGASQHAAPSASSPSAGSTTGSQSCAGRPAVAGQRLTITAADNGRTFCVPSGTTVIVFLHGTPAHMWSRIRPSSPILRPRPSGEMTLAIGITGGSFGATGVGTARLTSTRAQCQSVGHCTSQAFWVRLDIFGRA